MSGHEINHIQSPLVPKRSLLWILRPHSFQRHIDECHQKQIKQKPVQPNGRPIVQILLICTLDPPKAVAAMASNIPVNAKVFFLRLIEEMIPNKIAPTMRHWIKMRMVCIG